MKIAVWYHTRLFGGNPKINSTFSVQLMKEQMATLNKCGLQSAMQEMHVCSNGGIENQTAASQLAPKTAYIHDNGADAESVLRTINRLRQWCQQHRDWFVCLFHIKGVTHPWNKFNRVWRLCMEKHVLWNWARCVEDLEDGIDTAGAHWLTREVYGPQVTYPFWGGMFYWAQAKFLAELPELPDAPKCRQDWFLSENWIGMGATPIVQDYAPHWPGITPCTQSAAR